MVLTETGLAKVFQRVKSFVIAQLNSKASVLHTHTYSEIVDLPNGIAVDSTLDGTSSNAIANSAVSNALDGKIPKAGGAVITGNSIGRDTNTGNLDICGGTTFENGGFVALRGKNTNVTGQEGAVVIGTNNGSSSCNLTLLPNGTATWGNKEIDTIEEQGNGYIRYSSGLQICTGRVYVGNTGGAPRNFAFTFARSFAVAPVVTVGIVGANSGEYKGGAERVQETSCAGFVWTTADASIHIIAIGRWK